MVVVFLMFVVSCCGSGDEISSFLQFGAFLLEEKSRVFSKWENAECK